MAYSGESVPITRLPINSMRYRYAFVEDWWLVTISLGGVPFFLFSTHKNLNNQLIDLMVSMNKGLIRNSIGFMFQQLIEHNTFSNHHC